MDTIRWHVRDGYRSLVMLASDCRTRGLGAVPASIPGHEATILMERSLDS